MRTSFYLRVVFLFLGSFAQLHAREWRDSTGRYTVEAELIAFTEERVVLQREDGRLVAIAAGQLSEDDQEYLATKEVELAGDGSTQTWTLQGGWKLVGRVVGYGREEIVIQRRRGKVYVNERLYANLPEIYRLMLPRVVAHFEDLELESPPEFLKWVLAQRGAPRQFVLEGVMLELENGDEYVIPFFFFSEQDLELLKPGWVRWQAAHQDYPRREQEDLYVRAQAEAYRRDRRMHQEIAAMQLLLTAVDAGVVDLWEIFLTPSTGNPAPPQLVVAPGQNSQQAVRVALRRNPGFSVAGVRKLNR